MALGQDPTKRLDQQSLDDTFRAVLSRIITLVDVDMDTFLSSWLNSMIPKQCSSKPM